VTLTRFLLASLQLDFIFNERYFEGREKALASSLFPKTPEDVYTAMLQRIKGGDKFSSEVPFRALSWIFHSKRPLHFDELCEAISIEPSNKFDRSSLKTITAEKLISRCESFVKYEEVNDEFRFFHETANDHLKKIMKGQINPDIKPNLLSATDIAITCSACLDFAEINDPCVDTTAARAKLVQNYKFTRYAAMFWADHVREVEAEVVDTPYALNFLIDDNKRNSMLRIALGDGYAEGETVLHVAARNGLAILCERLLKKTLDKNKG